MLILFYKTTKNHTNQGFKLYSEVVVTTELQKSQALY